MLVDDSDGNGTKIVLFCGWLWKVALKFFIYNSDHGRKKGVLTD